MKKFTTKDLVLLGVLSAVIVVMAFTPLGYLKVGVISISLLMIPVCIGAVALGPVGGAILGAVFGLTSFAQCFGMDALGTTLASYNMPGIFVQLVLSRILAGAGAGFVFWLVSKKNDIAGYICAGLAGALLNTFLYMGGLVLIFGKTQEIASIKGDMNFFVFVAAVVGFNALIELAATSAVTAGVGMALKSSRLIGAKSAKTA